MELSLVPSAEWILRTLIISTLWAILMVSPQMAYTVVELLSLSFHPWPITSTGLGVLAPTQ